MATFTLRAGTGLALALLAVAVQSGAPASALSGAPTSALSAGASPKVRTLPPVVSSYHPASHASHVALSPLNKRLPAGRSLFSGTLTASAPLLVPQAPARTRSVPGTVPGYVYGSAQRALINQDRAANGGLSPLAWSPCLATVALQNAQRIAAQGYLSHTNGPNLDLACDPSYTTGGENIAYISSGIDDVEANTMFMNSAPHRANILNGAYRFVGTAWVVAPNGYAYIAVEFAG